MAKECYFFGTFNPPHIAHTKMARAVREEFGFDKIIFVPAFCPPHKETLDFCHRYNMLKLAVDKDFGCVSDIESKLQKPSYTFQTINFILNGKKQDSKGILNVRIPFIIGYDAISAIQSWKNPKFLKENLEFLVLKRKGEAEKEDIERLSGEGYCLKFVESVDFIEVSSNEIRKLIKEEKSTEGILDRKVREYIDEHRLYRL